MTVNIQVIIIVHVLYYLQILSTNPMFSSNPELRQQFTQALPAMTQQVSTRNTDPYFM